VLTPSALVVEFRLNNDSGW